MPNTNTTTASDQPERLTIRDEADWHPVNRAIEAVGEDYLLALWLGVPFFDYIALPRAGGLEQGIFDLMEHEAFFEKLHEEYIAWMRRVARVQNNQ